MFSAPLAHWELRAKESHATEASPGVTAKGVPTPAGSLKVANISTGQVETHEVLQLVPNWQDLWEVL